MNGASPQLAFSLAGHLVADAGQTRASAEGPYRFREIRGKTGFQPTSLRTVFHLPTDAHLSERGTIFLSVSPLETLATAAPMHGFLSKDPNAQEYGLLSDAFPVNDPAASVFAWYWRSAWHPQMIAKFKSGPAAGAHADYAVTPYVFVEHLPLREGEWYLLALTWDKGASRLRLYVNGILCGTTSYPFRAEVPKPGLYLGNTAMVFADLEIYETEFTPEEVEKKWKQSGAPINDAVQGELRALHTVQPKPKLNWIPDESWVLKYDESLCLPEHFQDWTQEGCLANGFALPRFEITPEGLLIETPSQIDVESRVYFWSPKSFEGDLAVELEFRPELNTGLALLILQASGMQREDILTDHPRRVTGSMNTIIGDRIRNYHWEFFRRAVDVRGDLGTQVLIKNPWYRPLGMSARPAFVPGEWYRLFFLQEGARLRGAINGEWVFDVYDTALANHGPVFNCGRIGLRLMYQTRIRFRNLRVWSATRSGGQMGAFID